MPESKMTNLYEERQKRYQIAAFVSFALGNLGSLVGAFLLAGSVIATVTAVPPTFPAVLMVLGSCGFVFLTGLCSLRGDPLFSHDKFEEPKLERASMVGALVRGFAFGITRCVAFQTAGLLLKAPLWLLKTAGKGLGLLVDLRVPEKIEEEAAQTIKIEKTVRTRLELAEASEEPEAGGRKVKLRNATLGASPANPAP